MISSLKKSFETLTNQSINFLTHEVLQYPGLEIESGGDQDRDNLGYYKCGNHDCPHVFTTDATRNMDVMLQ